MWYNQASSKQSRRLQTTVDRSEPYISSQTMADIMNEKEEQFCVYPELNDLRRKLFSQQTQQSRVKVHLDPEVIQKNYRKKMVEYLDSKFAQGQNKRKQQKPQVKFTQLKPKYSSLTNNFNSSHLKAFFRQYMEIIRSLNLKGISEYWLGAVLKELDFIKNMLEQRELISKLWRQLGQPCWIELFVFVAQLYFHGRTQRNSIYKDTVSKQQLTSAIISLLIEQGYPCSSHTIEKAYDTASQSIDFSSKLVLLTNRQNRPTCSSWSRSLSRKRV